MLGWWDQQVLMRVEWSGKADTKRLKGRGSPLHAPPPHISIPPTRSSSSLNCPFVGRSNSKNVLPFQTTSTSAGCCAHCCLLSLCCARPNLCLLPGTGTKINWFDLIDNDDKLVGNIKHEWIRSSFFLCFLAGQLTGWQYAIAYTKWSCTFDDSSLICDYWIDKRSSTRKGSSMQPEEQINLLPPLYCSHVISNLNLY